MGEVLEVPGTGRRLRVHGARGNVLNRVAPLPGQDLVGLLRGAPLPGFPHALGTDVLERRRRRHVGDQVAELPARVGHACQHPHKPQRRVFGEWHRCRQKCCGVRGELAAIARHIRVPIGAGGETMRDCRGRGRELGAIVNQERAQRLHAVTVELLHRERGERAQGAGSTPVTVDGTRRTHTPRLRVVQRHHIKRGEQRLRQLTELLHEPGICRLGQSDPDVAAARRARFRNQVRDAQLRRRAVPASGSARAVWARTSRPCIWRSPAS